MIPNSEQIDESILSKFELQKQIGKGAHSIVWKALSKKTHTLVALQKLVKFSEDLEDVSRLFREVMILQELADHENINCDLNIYISKNESTLFRAFGFMDTDLHAVIHSECVLEEVHKQYIIYQVLTALKYIHSGELIHCNLKPYNILINADCSVKISDFMKARSVAVGVEDTNLDEIEYICARWYKSPEIMLGTKKPTKSVDMWSVGCILGELISRKPMLPCTSTMDFLYNVIEMTGKPSLDELQTLNLIDTQNELLMSALKERKGSDLINEKSTKKSDEVLELMLPGASKDGLDLVKKLLCFNPTKRLTAEQALEHPYVREFRSKDAEINIGRVIPVLMKRLEKKEQVMEMFNKYKEKRKENRAKNAQKI